MKEILTEAIRRYPAGTKFLSAYSGNEKTVKGDLAICQHGTGIIDRDGCYVYDNDKWGEILSVPKSKELPIFN